MVVKLIVVIASLTLLINPVPPKHILFFGDSLTAGYGLSTDEAFPALVEKEFNKTSQQVKVTNAGLSG
ncbi:MAG TPA: hypothetical protein VF473_01860 [Cyclobacteriaceae bacterium]